MPLIFSKGWLFVFLAIMAVSLLRAYLKARTISRGLGTGAPLLKIQKPDAPRAPAGGERLRESLSEAAGFRKAGRWDEARALYGQVLEDPTVKDRREIYAQAHRGMGLCLLGMGRSGEEGAFLRAAESLRQALVLCPPSTCPEEHAEAQLDLGTALVELAGTRDSGEDLLAAAKAFFKGAEAAGEERPHLRSRLMLALGDAYERMARRGQDQEALEAMRRSSSAFAESARLLSAPDQVQDRSLVLVRLGRAFYKLSKLSGGRGDLQSAARAFEMALVNFPRERQPDLYAKVVAALAELERELGR